MITSIFRRFECKYLLDERRAARVRRAIMPFVQPDPHAAASPDTSYDIESLYLDAPDLRLYHETIEGNARRLKLRIRGYPDAPTDVGMFLEIKRKNDRLVLKDRAVVPRSVANRLVDGTATLVDEDLKPDQIACHDEFMAWMARWQARPVVWVRYRREAYMGIFQERLRITFDRDLRCAAGDSLQMPEDNVYYPSAPGGVVLELKFDSHFPDWLHRIVQREELQQQSYSKYGRAVQYGLSDHRLAPGTTGRIEAWS